MNSVVGGRGTQRIPEWLKTGLPDAYSVGAVSSRVSELGLSTICFEARCPNKRACFEDGAVTFLVLGRTCTRNCRFCNVASASPRPPDPTEPARLGKAVIALGLDHVIVTSVSRDDLADGGAGHFNACVESVGEIRPKPAIDVLVPDFRGDARAVGKVASGPIDVFGHNLETVERLYPRVRDRACYARSLRVLEYVRVNFPKVVVKSGLIVGIGETIEVVKTAVRHLADVGCEIITIGQYLRPSKLHLPVAEYIEPAVFGNLGDHARRLGLIPVCGPRVRSSFRARQAFEEAKLRRQTCA